MKRKCFGIARAGLSLSGYSAAAIMGKPFAVNTHVDDALGKYSRK